MTEDFDDDQVADGQIVDGGSSSDPSYGLIEVIFKPEAEDQYRTTLTIVSNDTEVSERTEEDDFGVWRVVLRESVGILAESSTPTFMILVLAQPVATSRRAVPSKTVGSSR